MRKFVVGLFVTLFSTFAVLSAQKVVYPPSDAQQDIAAALAASKVDGKHVLIDFGADWCPDCRVLGALFEDTTVAPFADANFHVVHVDVGRRDKNGDIAAKYHATSDAWIPAVVVLDPAGSVLAATDENLRLTRKYTPSELLGVLKQWAPKKTVQTLSTFAERGVRVTLALETDSSGGEWLSGRFAPEAADVHLYGKDLPIDGLDGLGRPTLLSVTDGANISARGAVIADRRVEGDRIAILEKTLPIYPVGPVTLRVPVKVSSHGRGRNIDVSVTYMGCGTNGCLPPVIDKHVTVTLPSAPR